MRRHVTGAIAVLAVAAGAQAGVYSSGVLGNFALNTTLTAPIPFNVGGSISDPIRAFMVRGAWTAGVGGPYSSELNATFDASTQRVMTGQSNGSPFNFPGVAATYNNTGYGGDLFNGPSLSGAHALQMRQSFGGSTATINNVEALMLTDALAPISSSLVAGGPVFNRPTSLTSLSAVGTAVLYNTHTFVAPSTGIYMLGLDTRGGTTTDPDGFLCLYNSAGFIPATPLVNLIGVDDDGGYGVGNSTAMAISLVAGQSYTAVATSFGNGEVGNYTFYIAGGEELQIPGPAGLALLGVAAAFGGRRRR